MSVKIVSPTTRNVEVAADGRLMTTFDEASLARIERIERILSACPHCAAALAFEVLGDTD